MIYVSTWKVYFVSYTTKYFLKDLSYTNAVLKYLRVQQSLKMG